MALAFVVFHSTYLFLSVCIRVNLWPQLFDRLAYIGSFTPVAAEDRAWSARGDALPRILELVPAGNDDRCQATDG